MTAGCSSSVPMVLPMCLKTSAAEFICIMPDDGGGNMKTVGRTKPVRTSPAEKVRKPKKPPGRKDE